MAEWDEIGRIHNSKAILSQSITALAFDPYQELLWTGDDKGRVASFHGTGMHPYTSFRSHESQVRQTLVCDRGVISLSSGRVKMNNRRGLGEWTISNEDTADLHCMTYTVMPNSEILVAGRQPQMLVINVARGTIVKKVDAESEIVVMRKSKLVCCGATTGQVTLRDPKTFKIEHRVQAHTGTISDIDTVGNLLLTCGFSARNGTFIIDPLVKVYDIRTMRPLAPISFPSGPCFLRMHPKLSTTVFIVSHSGQFHVLDVVNTSDIHFYQANTTSYINAIDISSTGEMFAFGDADNFIHLWGDSKEPKMNEFSNPIELMSPHVLPPSVRIGENDSLALVGMPYYKEPLLSVWPSNKIFEVGIPPPKIDQDILSNIKTIDFVGFAPNNTNRRRNEIVKWSRKGHKPGQPKFRSEKEREMHRGRGAGAQEQNRLFDEEERNITGTKMPKYYQQVEIQYSRFGVDDFDFEYYNETQYGGLETHIANSYCNSLLQVLFFTPILREITKVHIGSVCPKENCLCCELGFLFRMLEDAKGSNCQATNFLKAFSKIPQASALSLFEPEEHDETISYAQLIQNFNRFILEQLHQECNTDNNQRLLKHLPLDEKNYSVIQQVFGMQMALVSRCQCQRETERMTIPFVVDLQKNKNVKGNTKGKEPAVRRFEDVLSGSICRETQTKAWCNQCQQYQPSLVKKIPKSLPPVLVINCGLGNAVPSELWRSVVNQKSWLPTRITMDLEGDDLKIETTLEGNDQETSTNGSPCHAKYELTAIITQIEPEKETPHITAFIRIPKKELEPTSKSEWYLFNDFLVKNVNEQEVFNFQGLWKVPVLLYFTRIDIDALVDISALPNEVDHSILFEDTSIAKKSIAPIPKPFQLLSLEETPQPGTLVAIDAEFVALSQEETEIRSDGTKSVIRPSRLSLARVSVLRGEGEKEGIPFIDDYIATSDPVVDYLTEYSGIKAGDLDPATSRHTLVPLKVAYKKLRLLLDLGCVFVGHGLKKDFRIINILVPPEQVIDTVEIFHIKNRQRKISLRFLAWCLLNQDIQTESHDSVEDARTALLLYKKYIQFKAEGIFEEILEEIYKEGKKHNWKPTPGMFPKPPNGSSSATFSLTSVTAHSLSTETYLNNDALSTSMTNKSEDGDRTELSDVVAPVTSQRTTTSPSWRSETAGESKISMPSASKSSHRSEQLMSLPDGERPKYDSSAGTSPLLLPTFD